MSGSQEVLAGGEDVVGVDSIHKALELFSRDG